MPAIELTRSGGTALWRQVEQDLRRRIEQGEYADVFPGEKALAAEYGVSRQTMRQALRPLRESGVVTAERGRAPRIRPEVLEQPVGSLYSLFTSVEAAGMSQHSRTLVLDERQDTAVAQRLGLAPGALLVHLRRLRLAGDVPLALDAVWLPADVARPLLEVDFSHTALYREMASRLGISPSEGSERIESVSLGADDAHSLATTAGAPAFRIERTGRARDRTIELRTTLLRADRFRLISYFSPRHGVQWGIDTEARDLTPTAP